MASERFKLRAAVYLLFIKNNKVLLLRRFNTGWSDGMYSLVSGHADGNESLLQAACREAKEEAGIKLAPKDLRFEHVMHRTSDVEYIDFFFVVKAWQDEPRNTEPEKCDDMQWFALDAIPDNTLPYVKRVLENYGKGIAYSEDGWDVSSAD